MPELRRAGRSIYYETHGSGPALLLSHGFSATSQMWIGQISELSKRHQLILWDMCGHGRSESPEDACLYSEAHTVADMRALLDHLGHRLGDHWGAVTRGLHVSCVPCGSS